MTLTAGQLDADGSPLEPQGVIAASELEFDSANTNGFQLQMVLKFYGIET